MAGVECAQSLGAVSGSLVPFISGKYAFDTQALDCTAWGSFAKTSP